MKNRRVSLATELMCSLYFKNFENQIDMIHIILKKNLDVIWDVSYKHAKLQRQILKISGLNKNAKI
jgi:hypothetical protein